jgi:hypothetical protein
MPASLTTPPTAPDPADCCGEGCSNCVFDQYEAAMQRWRDRQARLQDAAASPGCTGGAETDRSD